MVLVASLLALLIAFSKASPIRRDLESTVESAVVSTVESTVGWVSEPDGRGTFSILSSCVLTLSLCVYTAIHLNVPGINEIRAVRFFRTTRWVVLGIFAPELVVWTAWRQWASARGISRIVNQQQATSRSPFESVRRVITQSLLQQKSPPLDSSKIPSGTQRSQTFYNPERWTTIHGFYAGMGGFVFDLPYTMDGHQHKSQDQFTRLTLTAEGVEFLARCGLLPQITAEDIVDKSKADSLSKFLACLQALWMLVQVLGRVATDLPVTLIEVNTLAHVVCALITYVLWWFKPKEIHSPTRLQGDWVAPVCSYMYMTSKMSGWKKHQPGLLSKSWYEPEMSLLVFVPDSENQEKTANITEEEATAVNKISPNNYPAQQPNDSYHAGVRFRPPPLTNAKRRSTLTGAFRPRPEVCPSHDDNEMQHQITQLDRLRSSSISASARWALAAEAVANFPSIADYLVDPKTTKPNSQADYLEPVTKELLVPYSSNHSSEGLVREFNGTVVGTVLWFSCAVFGAIHVAAWDAFFPSKVEMWLWRSSGAFIAFSGLLWLAINGLASISKRFDTFWESVLAMKAKSWVYGGIGALSGVCGICFVFSRAYLVLEAFISLRSLPPGAYETPDWTQVIPHL